MNRRVLGFTVGVTVVTVLGFGLGPALLATRMRPRDAIGGAHPLAEPDHGSLRKVVLVGQIGLSLGLLVAAGLLVGTSRQPRNRDPGGRRSRPADLLPSVLLRRACRRLDLQGTPPGDVVHLLRRPRSAPLRVGLFGSISYGVGRRRAEIGIRTALGATGPEVMSLVLREATFLLGVGLLLGAGVSVVSVRLVTAFLYGLSPADPLVLIGSATVLTITALATAALPAWRASRMDPISILRKQ